MSGCRSKPKPPSRAAALASSLLGLLHGLADHHEVVRVADELPGALLGPGPIERVQVNVGQQRGNDPALGVPVTVSETTPSANTPARSHCRISLSTRRSDTRRSTSTINRSWSIEPKKSRMSASNTNLPPRGNATRITSKASVALRLGRNPKLHGRKSASKIGSRTSFAACCATRSRTVGIPNGRFRPSGLGISTRRTGDG